MTTPDQKPPRALVILIAVLATVMAIPGGVFIALMIISVALKM